MTTFLFASSFGTTKTAISKRSSQWQSDYATARTAFEDAVKRRTRQAHNASPESTPKSEKSMKEANCDRRRKPLIEIDHYGEQLIGCIDCNCWRGNRSAFIVDLSVEEIQAL